MKGILASFILSAGVLSVSAQEPVPAPKPAETPTKADAPVKTTPAAAPVVEKKEPASKIDEPISVCDLGLQHSPIVSGLQLRMPEAEAALKAHTQFQSDPANAAQKSMSVKLDKDPILEGLSSAAMSSRDARVNFIKLSYPKSYASIKDFITDFAPKLGVSRIGFRVDREKNEALMICKEFTVEMKTGPSGSELTLTEKPRP
jgi:hypothetical protein